MKNSVLGNKIVVVGPTGSGKTTFAAKLSRSVNIAHTELDSLFWKPNWVESGNEEFREKINNVTSQSQWIIDGNYAKSQDLTIARADTVIWMDCRKSITLYRVFFRSIKRLIDRKLLWETNKESITQFFSPKRSIFTYAVKAYKYKKNRYNKMFADENYSNINWIRIKNKKDEKEFWKKSRNEEYSSDGRGAIR